MTHDAGHSIAWLLSSATGIVVAAAPQVPVGDEQVIAISVGIGLIGGLASTLASELTITKRELAKRVLASGMAAPAIVAGIILWYVPNPTLLGVFGLAFTAGLVAWPISQLLPKLAPSILRNAIKKWLGGGDK